jgi:uroporphyrinogen III methyltransferase/synthase
MPSNSERRPLAGKRIVVTRAAEQAGELARMLEGAGAQVLLLPLVQFVEAKNTESLDAALRDLGNFDWLILTSANAVRFIVKRLTEIGLSPVMDTKGAQIGCPRVAAVGPATARAASAAGLSVDMVAARQGGRALAAEILAKLGPRMRGARVLLPRSDRADDVVPSLLREAGAEVTEVVAYCTEQAGGFDSEVLQEIRRGRVDVITLASPSAFGVVTKLLGTEMLQRICQRTAIAAIGHTTAAAIHEFGLPAPIEAREATSSGMVEAIIQHYRACQTRVSAICCTGVAPS